MTTITAAIQWLNLAGLGGVVLAVVILWRRYPDTRGLIAPPLLWAVYGCIFYVLVLTGRLSSAEVLLWGAVHRLLAVYGVLGGLAALWAILRWPPEKLDD
jgi:hypothetical protein